MNQKVEDPIVLKVMSKFYDRSQRGIEKYGQTLMRDDLNLIEWLNHLQEELMDATLYIEKLKAELKPNPCLYLNGCDGKRCHNCATFKQQEQ
jgi:hypothetical protein